jgi:multiple sugar transport system permease protein/arabinogalactan oligomer/maltooligosaccharide transport system permease protein
VSIVGAYSISRYDYPGSQHLVIGFVSSQMLPRVLILIPFFTVVLTLGILDTYRGIILAHSVVTIPFTIWLLKGYFDDIPQSLDEAAKLDGCSDLDVLFRVILPLSLPGLSVGFFYTFVLSWNDFLFVSMLSQSQGTRTLPFALFLFQNSNVVDWGATLTAAVITMAPVIVLFALVQRYIIEGLATGGSKGL